MQKKHSFWAGTVILTAAGLTSRLIGFFYRAFLSQTFGEEGMGIYQLLSPVMALSFSLTAAGIQTAVSKFTASETTTHDYRSSLRILCAGLLLSMPLSAACAWLLYRHAQFIALTFLLEERTAPLLRVFALSIPFCALHSLVNGYFYGVKRAGIPAATQIAEQLARVGSVYLICSYLEAHRQAPGIVCAMIGLTIGECFSTLLSLAAVCLRFLRLSPPPSFSPSFRRPLRRALSLRESLRRILFLAMPLTASRIAVNFLQSIEAVSIPDALVRYGYSHSQALSVYGVLTGMALPLILFPTALVNSACVLLLPVVSEADENGRHGTIRRLVHRSILYCTLFGALCTAGFLLIGRRAGFFLFHSEMAGSFILTLSFICPLLYLSGALSSILHGLGKTGTTFLLNMIVLVSRLFFIFRLVPLIGIQGYLYGLLLTQLLLTGLCILAVCRYTGGKTPPSSIGGEI